MATHKYAAGQSVRFFPHHYQGAAGQGIYTIVMRLPEEGNVPQYRIKAKTNGQERIVLEDQLSRV